MTKEEFEEKVLLNTSTTEEYEENRLIKDVYYYYDFKILVDLISKTLHQQYNKKLFGKSRIADLIESVDKIKNMIHDEKIEFTFLTSVKNKDMNTIFKYLGTEQAKNLYMGVLRRLYNYQDYTNYSIEDILSKADELDYVLELEEKDKAKFEVWCESHPNINIEEEKEKRNANQL